MRLKDYLRGLGMGVLVSVLILTIAGGDEMTDAQVRARAAELGMVDGSNLTLSDIQTQQSASSGAEEESEEAEDAEGTDPFENTESDESTNPSEKAEDGERTDPSEKAESTDPSENVESDRSTEASEDTESSKTMEETMESEAPTVDATEDDAKPVLITVVRGDSSVSVSKDLAQAGLVESAKDFDAYLCQNGYDKRISVGSFEILPGSTYEEIAKIISKSK